MSEPIKLVLNENTFTGVCKSGEIVYGSGYYKVSLNINKQNMKSLALGESVILESNISDERFEVVTQNITLETAKEILKRAPLYSDMYYTL